MQADKIEAVMSEFLGEGYRIVGDDGALSPAIEWVDWVCGPDDNDDGDGDDGEKVEVTFQDGSTRTFNKGVPMRQIWHEYAD
ncbi:hypothetical protein CJ186_07145 [Actinomyces graevenitzii]|uniref:hypothetical protein n=1 Tax=Actinomyces graevenitzii TaxID=55565 RepID=UPI000C800112|nr:hypothetical protein [Actinomyces graevenitzii]PMC91315.1 hypothetical protein CJ186_07145 [Actinomyces graevenitzii]